MRKYPYAPILYPRFPYLITHNFFMVISYYRPFIVLHLNCNYEGILEKYIPENSSDLLRLVSVLRRPSTTEYFHFETIWPIIFEFNVKQYWGKRNLQLHAIILALNES